MRYAFLFLLGLFCFVAVSAQPVIDLPDSEIEWTETEHTFGEVQEGDPVEHTYWFKNAGNNTLRIYNVLPTCGCTTPDWTKDDVAPGQKGFVTLKFDSHGRMGIQNKMVTVVANTQPRNSVLKFTVDVFAGPPPGPDDHIGEEGHIVPPPDRGNQSVETVLQPTTAISFTETEFNFDTISSGDSVIHEFHFINTGGSDLKISDVRSSCGCTIPAWPRDAIAPGKGGVIQVKFDSKGKMGLQDKTVTVRSNAEPSTVVLHIKGTVEMGPKGRIQLNTALWKYKKKGAPKKLKNTFTFTNTGDAPLKIISVETNCACLSVEKPSKTFAPGETGEIPVTLFTKGCACEGAMLVIFYTNGFPDEAGITIMGE